MTFHELIVSILVVAVCIYLGMAMLDIARRQDGAMFKEELIWYDRYTIVRDMVLHEMPDLDIVHNLLETNYPGWEFDEIIQMIEIARNY